MKTVAYSPNDFNLLLRLRGDLIKAGFEDDKEWNDGRIRIERMPEYSFSKIGDVITVYNAWLHFDDGFFIRLHPHNSGMDYITITASSYSEVLQTFIDNHKK